MFLGERRLLADPPKNGTTFQLLLKKGKREGGLELNVWQRISAPNRRGGREGREREQLHYAERMSSANLFVPPDRERGEEEKKRGGN